MKLRLTLFIAACLPLAHEALACSACFGAPGAPQTQGMNNAILLLLGVTATVAGGAGAVALRIVRSESHAPALPAPFEKSPDEESTP